MSRSARKLAPRVLLALVASIMALAGVEGLARLLLPEWRPAGGELADFWSYHETLGWAHRPNAAGRFTGPGWGADVQINSHGLRDIEHEYAPSIDRRVLVLGDSFGWGYGVDADDGIVARLRRLCSDHEFINASVTGYGTDQQYLFYKSEGHRYDAKTLLLLIYANDVVETSCDNMYGYPKPRFVWRNGELELTNVPVPKRSPWLLAYGWLNRNSYLFSHILLVTGWVHEINVGCDHFDPSVTQRLLTQFASELRAEGIELRWVLIPETPGQPSRLARLYRRLAIRERVALLDLAPTLAAATRRGELLTLPHDGHWNADGHRTAAQAVAEDLGCLP